MRTCHTRISFSKTVISIFFFLSSKSQLERVFEHRWTLCSHERHNMICVCVCEHESFFSLTILFFFSSLFLHRPFSLIQGAMSFRQRVDIHVCFSPLLCFLLFVSLGSGDDRSAEIASTTNARKTHKLSEHHFCFVFFFHYFSFLFPDSGSIIKTS